MPMPRKPDPLKHCQQCGKRMNRKTINGRVEDMTVFRRRKYCNRRCMARAFIKIDPTLSALRKRVEGYKKGTCEVCAATQALSVHHMDENPENNRPSNLRTLCNSCHQIWHWHFGKTRPKKRSSLPCDTE